MKVDTFDGKGCTVDQDIYLNKFETDNYFNVLHAGASQSLSGDNKPFKGNGTGGAGVVDNHGIGLFDSIVMKDASSEIKAFTLTGSVNTEVYSNDYSASDKELIYVDTTSNDSTCSLWLSVGGVCGWSTNGVDVKFSNIALNDLTINGADFIGGLLGFSGLCSAAKKIVIQQCSADDISLKMTSAHQVGDAKQTRNAMGAFVGKVQEGAVVIYGTNNGKENTDLTDYSEVKIKSHGFGNDSLNYYASTGGLVGFAGHCCQAYDMKVISSNDTVTIGKSDVGYSGGIVGVMQPYNKGDPTGYAEFVNCTVENLNVAAINAGGYYGGKWDGDYVPYRITLNNCKLIGNGSNSITGMDYAGGLVGQGNVYTRLNVSDSNITISDCKVSNYTIKATADNKFAGGFVGYCKSQQNALTCYIHDSSVENCVIGQGSDYAGGAIGGIVKKTNSKNYILGYNIKLDNVTSPSSNNNKMGAWVGNMDTNDTYTSIQFTGVAIYGTGFSKNIGNWNDTQNKDNTNASFVFADYTGACNGTSTETTTSKQEGDNNSVTESYAIDQTKKIITRTIVTVTISGDDKKTKTQTIDYRYGSEVAEEAVAVEGGVSENSTTWSISESEGKIYKVVSNASADTVTTTTYTIDVSGYNSSNNVTMPKYPFVNINPHSSMGAGEIISGDGAVHGSTASSTNDYMGKTAEKTIALKIYEDTQLTDTSATNYSRLK